MTPPAELLNKICDTTELSPLANQYTNTEWSDSDKVFIVPCFSDGSYLAYILWNRIQHGVHWWWALRNLYGVELMQDNVEETKQRVIKLLDALEVDYDEDLAMDVMDYNLVCSDFFEWDFEAWCKKGETPHVCTTKIIGDEEYKEFR